jgi:hypothetical protein
MYFLRGIFDRIVLVMAIVASGSIPSFIAQYRQRVGGRLDQVLQDLAPFQAIANQFHHGDLQELIQHHLSSSDLTFHNEGAAIQAMTNSAELLKKALDALNADLFHQLIYLATKIDPLIARATWDTFAPSFNLTSESIVFAVIAGILIWFVFLAMWNIISGFIKIVSAHTSL